MTAQKTVLIAEDDRELKTLLSLLLERDGYRVLNTSDPIEAANKLGTGLFEVDLLVADIAMPGMSGPEFAREPRTICPGLKILFMTGAKPGSPCASLASIVAHDCILEKPFSEREFKEAVAAALNH